MTTEGLKKVTLTSSINLEDGFKDQFAETTCFARSWLLGPLSSLINEVVSPQFLNVLVALSFVSLGVGISELFQTESPAVKTRSETNGSLDGSDHSLGTSGGSIDGDDGVDVLDNLTESVVQRILEIGGSYHGYLIASVLVKGGEQV